MKKLNKLTWVLLLMTIVTGTVATAQNELRTIEDVLDHFRINPRNGDINGNEWSRTNNNWIYNPNFRNDKLPSRTAVGNSPILSQIANNTAEYTNLHSNGHLVNHEEGRSVYVHRYRHKPSGFVLLIYVEGEPVDYNPNDYRNPNPDTSEEDTNVTTIDRGNDRFDIYYGDIRPTANQQWAILNQYFFGTYNSNTRSVYRPPSSVQTDPDDPEDLRNSINRICGEPFSSGNALSLVSLKARLHEVLNEHSGLVATLGEVPPAYFNGDLKDHDLQAITSAICSGGSPSTVSDLITSRIFDGPLNPIVKRIEQYMTLNLSEKKFLNQYPVKAENLMDILSIDLSEEVVKFIKEEELPEIMRGENVSQPATESSFRFKNYMDDLNTLAAIPFADNAIYALGVFAGIGDGLIETGITAYSLLKEYNGFTQMYKLVTDPGGVYDDTVKNWKKLKEAWDFLFDFDKQLKLWNYLGQELGEWFADTTFDNGPAHAGYAHGKVVFEVLGLFVGITEIKTLLNTGKFSNNILNQVRKVTTGLRERGLRIRRSPDGEVTVSNSSGNDVVKGKEEVNRFLLDTSEFLEFLTVNGKVKKAGNKSNLFNSFSDVDNTNIPSKYLIDEQRFNDLARDPDQGFNIKKATRKEAMTGLEAESQRILSNIERGPKGIEFYDTNRIPWDVKTPPGDFFNVNSIGQSIKKELTKSKTIDGVVHPAGKFIDPITGKTEFKKILLDCTYINDSQLSSLRNWLRNESGLSQAELSRIIEINVNL